MLSSYVILLILAPEQLNIAVMSLRKEQQTLCQNAAGSTLSSRRLRQRLAIAHRVLVALGRQPSAEKTDPQLKVPAQKPHKSRLQRKTPYLLRALQC